MIERINVPDSAQEEKFIARIKQDSKGRTWYLNEERQVILLDDTGKSELRRQQSERAAGNPVVPTDGFPLFGTMMGFAEMPATPGKVVPTAETVPSTDASGSGETSFERRAREARERSKKPSDSGDTIPMPDLSAGDIKPASPTPEPVPPVGPTPDAELPPLTVRATVRKRAPRAASGKKAEATPATPSAAPATSPEAAPVAAGAAPASPEAPTPESTYDLKRFRLYVHPDRARGTAGLDTPPNLYVYFLTDDPKSPVLTNPDGSTRFFTQEEYEILQAVSKVPNAVPPSLEPSKPTDVVNTPKTPEKKRTPSDVVSLDLTRIPKLGKGVKAITQREIQANPEQERLFLKVFNRVAPESGPGIYARAVNGELLNPKELQLLAYARHEFANKLHAGQEIVEKIGTTDVEIAMRRNEVFRNQVELNGISRTMEVMRAQTLTLIMKMDQVDFEKVVNAYQILDKKRNTSTYRKYERETEAVLSKSNASYEEYDDIFKLASGGDRKETRARVAERIAEHHGAFRNALATINPFFKHSRVYKADKIVRTADKLEQKLQKPGTIKEVDEQLEVITKFMALTLNHDPVVQLALQQSAFRNENLKPAEEKPATFEEMRAEKTKFESGVFAAPSLKKEWEQHTKVIPGFDSKPREEKLKELDRWTPPSVSSRLASPEGEEKPRSFIGRVMEAIINALLGRQKQELRKTI